MQLGSGAPMHRFKLAMYGYGNEASLVNDPNTYQLEDPNVPVLREGQENVKV